MSAASRATQIELEGHARTAYVTVRYAGASGDFNPIHIDEEFAQQVGLPGRILHGLWTMAQVARAHTEAAGGPETLEARCRSSSAGWARSARRSSSTGTVARGRGRGRASSTREADAGRASGSSATRSRRSRRLTERRRRATGGPRRRTYNPCVLTDRQELVLRKVVEEYLEAGRARRLEGRWRPTFEWGPSTIRHELANLEELGLLAHPHTSAGPGPDRGRLPLLRRPPAAARGRRRPRCRCRSCAASSTRRCG